MLLTLILPNPGPALFDEAEKGAGILIHIEHICP